jgi:glyoxylase-like metal-dependent hydrolase (beta-lactamase superfamily II)
MKPLATGISFLDLNFQNRPGVVATAVLHEPGGVALIDPGPSSTIPTLREELSTAGIRLRDVTALVLTHIHLDHAGACGVLVRDNPNLRVYVHEKGAPHLADPAKLVASATRLYGNEMDQLWGEIIAVPQDAVTSLAGGERIEVGGRQLAVEYTPGHASHHVSYWCADVGIAFVGDTGGIKRGPSSFLLPPTPPPDIDLELWYGSLDRIGRWHADTLFLTHFGPASPAAAHLVGYRDQLAWFGELARVSLEREEDDTARAKWFVDEVRRDLSRRAGQSEVAAYELAGGLTMSWGGLARYWRKRAQR